MSLCDAIPAAIQLCFDFDFFNLTRSFPRLHHFCQSPRSDLLRILLSRM